MVLLLRSNLILESSSVQFSDNAGVN